MVLLCGTYYYVRTHMERLILTRDQATERGLSRYFTGVTCRHGHRDDRFTSNGGCVACINRKIPKQIKTSGFKFLPDRALNFGNAKGAVPSVAEAHAVFRWLEAAEWHLRALEILRADPELMRRFDHEMTNVEKFETGRATPNPSPVAKS